MNFALLQKEERIRGLHKWASMACSFVKMWKMFHPKWSFVIAKPPLFGLRCVPPNLLQSSKSMILSTSNEYNITFMTSKKTLKPMLSLPLLCHLWLAIARIMSKGFSNLTPTFLPTITLSVESGVSTSHIMVPTMVLPTWEKLFLQKKKKKKKNLGCNYNS